MPPPSASWKKLAVQVPGIDLLKQVRSVLETLLIYLEVLKTILETVKTFLIDFGNPIRVLVEALIKLILTLFEALKRTGIYTYFDVPDFDSDPSARRTIGGQAAFFSRWRGSFYDARDANRPQPIPNALQGGFVLIVVEADAISDLLRYIKSLLSFFGRKFTRPNYPPPANVRALPLGANGDPILSVVKLFKDQPQAIAVEWSLPSTTFQPDPHYENLVAQVSTELFPPKFLIERSSIPLNKEVTSDHLAKSGYVGYGTHLAETEIEDNGQPGIVSSRKIRLADENGEPFVKFESYAVISASENTASFLLGQLGTFRFIDTSAEFDKTYYYRVRAFSGSILMQQDGNIPFFTQTRDPTEPNTDGTNIMVVWPAEDVSDQPVVGRASAIVKCRLTKIPPKFDVIEAIRKVFLTALSWNFHVPPSPDAEFDSAGLPIAPTLTSEIGQGLLFGKTSALNHVTSAGTVGALTSLAEYKPDAVTGKYPQMPWQMWNVRFNAARLTIKIASALLEQGGVTIGQFQTYMQGTWPSAAPEVLIPVSIKEQNKRVKNLEEMVTSLTEISYDSADQPPDGEAVTKIMLSKGYVVPSTVSAWTSAFYDANSRRNLAVVVNFLLNLAYGGVPPNWESASLLRDLFPWSAALLYELMAKIQALLDAFKGVLDEIKTFIDLLIRKINVLEKLIKFLIAILDFLDSLSNLGAYMLSVTGLSGDASEWMAAVENAEGAKPKSGPNGYAAGVCLAYLAPDVAAFETAFGMIF